jgi:hypothetical protein
MFTLLRNGHPCEFADLIDVLEEATADDPVYDTDRGWMTVGDLRWQLPTGFDGGSPLVDGRLG